MEQNLSENSIKLSQSLTKQKALIITFLVGLITICLLILVVFSYNKITPSKKSFYGTLLQNPVLIEKIKLQHANLGAVDLSNWQGDVLLIFFGFTHCPDVCPLTFGRLAKIYHDLEEPEDLQIIMVSIDPERDTLEVVQDYASSFHKDFIGLSGSPAEVALAAKNFFVGYKELPDQGQFIHTDSLAILDREGYMRLVYSQNSILDIDKDLRAILAQESW